MKRVYICHPYRDDPEENIEKVRQIVDEVAKCQIKEISEWEKDCKKLGIPISADIIERQSFFVCPVSPMLAFTDAMNEPSGATEAQGMAFCLCLLKGCDEIWVYSNAPTKGMREEITFASQNDIKVVWKA